MSDSQISYLYVGRFPIVIPIKSTLTHINDLFADWPVWAVASVLMVEMPGFEPGCRHLFKYSVYYHYVSQHVLNYTR